MKNNSTLTHHTYIETSEQLKEFRQQNKGILWMGFDTEFVGEKTYVPILCLIQVATENGTYLIDPLKLPNIDLFIELVVDESILKITHAGDNDYRLLHQLYGVVPKNVFDTQIAAGFIGYNYPVSFANLLQGELKIGLDKGSAVSDWESRPISAKQLQYALNDVIYLRTLWEKITQKLTKLNRERWLCEEFKKIQEESTYVSDPHKEFYANSLLPKLNIKEKVFLMRLYQYRIERAEQTNQPKERILQKKYIAHIAKAIKGGKKALVNNRLIPPHVVDKKADAFVEMFQKPITPGEQEVLNGITQDRPISQRIDAVMDIIYLGIKIICSDQKVAPEMVINRANFKKMKADLGYMDTSLTTGWRHDLLGENVIRSIELRNKLKVDTNSAFFGLIER